MQEGMRTQVQGGGEGVSFNCCFWADCSPALPTRKLAGLAIVLSMYADIVTDDGRVPPTASTTSTRPRLAMGYGEYATRITPDVEPEWVRSLGWRV